MCLDERVIRALNFTAEIHTEVLNKPHHMFSMCSLSLSLFHRTTSNLLFCIISSNQRHTSKSLKGGSRQLEKRRSAVKMRKCLKTLYKTQTLSFSASLSNLRILINEDRPFIRSYFIKMQQLTKLSFTLSNIINMYM